MQINFDFFTMLFVGNPRSRVCAAITQDLARATLLQSLSTAGRMATAMSQIPCSIAMITLMS
jgi:hypothetical protein